MGEWIQGIHHVNLKANSPEKFRETVRFYAEVLGMDIIRNSDGEGGRWSAMIDTGAGRMEIGMADDVLPQGSIRHIALATSRVPEVAERVRAAGYQITKEPFEASIATIAFCIGPCGEEIELFDEK